MIDILIVEDNQHKRDNIKKTVLSSLNISEDELDIVDCIKDAKVLLYTKSFDLMILDLVLPIESGDDADAKNGAQFLEEINSHPIMKPPIHIVGISGYSDKISDYHEIFTKKLWNLIDYSADSTSWQDQLKSIIYHLVKTRQSFLNHSERKYDYDVAIVTALATPELEAILRLNNSRWTPIEVKNDFTKYYTSTFINGDKSWRVVAATADQMGMTASSHLSTKLIMNFTPKYIIMAGIAAGIKDRGLGFGDVLVAEQSWDYGSGKIVEISRGENNEIVEVGFQPDTRDIQLSADLKAKVGSFKLSRSSIMAKISSDWQGESPETKLQVHLGPIASGSYVISSSNKLQEIKEHQRKLLGIEMETYGLYYAAEHSLEPKPKALSAKSVSDYGDGQKNDKFQKYAAFTSANFIYQFIINEL